MIKVQLRDTEKFYSQAEYKTELSAVETAVRTVQDSSGPGAEFLGWYDLPVNYNRDEFGRVLEAASKIRDESDVLIVAGIGGSYLGAKAGIEALTPLYDTDRMRKERLVPEIIFVGNNLNPRYLTEILKYVEGKEISLNVVSKSGSTIETALAFRVFKLYLEEKYGEKAADRFYCTTDSSKGILRGIAEKEGYESFVIPDSIGGRYSVLTPVGLLPLAVAGLDIEALILGAQEEKMRFESNPFANDILKYVVHRNLLLQKGRSVEILATFEPHLNTLSEWWKQLFGESEGKEGKGIFPASVTYSTDLHSLGQYLQDGQPILQETFLYVKKHNYDYIIPEIEDDFDGLNYLANKRMSDIQELAMKGTALAHYDGDTPIAMIALDYLDEYHIGALFYFFELACAISAYHLKVNPFNQEGVEAYKENMFALLGKPGTENARLELEKRLNE